MIQTRNYSQIINLINYLTKPHKTINKQILIVLDFYAYIWIIKIKLKIFNMMVNLIDQ